MPEGDTILSIAGRLRPVLVDKPLHEIATPQRRHALDRWPEKLAGARIGAIDTHGKHLFLRLDNGLTIHSHLRMSGRWRHLRAPASTRPPRAGRVAGARDRRHSVVQFNGPVLELIRDSRLRYDPYLRALGPDILADGAATGRRSSRGCAPTTRRVPSPTHCSTSARWRASATCGRTRASTPAGSTRGGRCRTSATRSLERIVRCARDMMRREVRHGGRLAAARCSSRAARGAARCGTASG